MSQIRILINSSILINNINIILIILSTCDFCKCKTGFGILGGGIGGGYSGGGGGHAIGGGLGGGHGGAAYYGK